MKNPDGKTYFMLIKEMSQEGISMKEISSRLDIPYRLARHILYENYRKGELIYNENISISNKKPVRESQDREVYNAREEHRKTIFVGGSEYADEYGLVVANEGDIL